MSGIFVSYRRDDSSGYATLLYERLASRYGHANVFMDVDSLQPGIDYGTSIESHVDSCDVMITLIGRRWLAAADSAGARRLDDPDDWVRSEVASALARDVRVIPVLVDGATMPGAVELPEPIAGLARREALALSNRHIRQDVRRLSDAIDEELAVRGVRPLWHRVRGRLGRRGILAAAAVCAAALVAVAALALTGPGDADGSPQVRQFSANVDTILEQSAPFRGQISTLVSQLGHGAAPTKDQRLRLGDIINNRRVLAKAARRLEAPTSSAREARAQLITAFDASLRVDREVETCTDRPSRGARAACLAGVGPLSAVASNAKDAFVHTYNEILRQLGRGAASPNF